MKRRRRSSTEHLRASRILTPSFWTTFWQSKWSAAWSRQWNTSPPTPPVTPRPSLRQTKLPQSGLPPVWTQRRYISTPPPALPTAASSVWAARWAFPPKNSTPEDLWDWVSFVRSNMKRFTKKFLSVKRTENFTERGKSLVTAPKS